MKRNLSRPQIILALFFLALAGAGAAASFILLAIPPDAKNAFILGFSLQRLLLLLFIVLPSGGALYAAIRAALQPLWVLYKLEPTLSRIAARGWIFVLGGLLAVLAWIVLFLPPYWFGDLRAYYLRLRPDLLWLGFCGGLTFALLWVWKRGWRPRRILVEMRFEVELLRASLVGAAIMFGLWLLIAVTGLGIVPDPLFWHEAGVPVLGIQVIISLLIVACFKRLVPGGGTVVRKVWIDWALIAGLWLAAFLLWQLTPMPRSPFAPGPYPPNNVYYPYSDAEGYDTSAQYLLMGHGIANGDFLDKPVYSLILALLHLIAGQNYPMLVSLQVGLLAFVPVGMYLLGKTIHGREAGLLAALFAIFQQRNAIAATLDIQVSTSKLLMTEYPAAMVLIFLTLIVVRWFQSIEHRPALALTSGGLLGLTALLRPNVLLLVPILLAAILFRLRRTFRRGLLASGLFTLTFLAAFIPWNMVIPRGYDSPYLIAKARALFDTRYKMNIPSSSDTTPKPVLLAIADRASFKLAQPQPLSIPLTSVQEQPQDTSYSFIPKHYFHNEIMSFFILPHTVELKDLDHTLQTPYWRGIAAWDGSLPVGSILLVCLNLGILAVGLGLAWKHWRLTGLIPLIIHVGYYLANGLVRNSGARYLVPVDWVVLLYYALGMIQVIRWLGAIFRVEPEVSSNLPSGSQMEEVGVGPTRLSWQRGTLIGLIFLALGSVAPLSKYIFPDQFPEKPPAQILGDLHSLEWEDSRVVAWLDQLGAAAEISQPGTAVVYGRGLYPRWYAAGTSETARELTSDQLPPDIGSYLTLRVLAPDYPYWAILPLSEIQDEFPDGAPVAIIGCWYGGQKYIDSAAILVMTNPAKVYWRSSSAELSCRLPQP